MIVLDTDHLSELEAGSVVGLWLRDQLLRSPDQVIVTTIISVEERFRGRLASVAGAKSTSGEVQAYEGLSRLIEFISGWTVLPYDDDARSVFVSLPPKIARQKPMDCKIAAITIARGALLLTRNRSDFVRIPGVRFEDWLTETSGQQSGSSEA